MKLSFADIRKRKEKEKKRLWKKVRVWEDRRCVGRATVVRWRGRGRERDWGYKPLRALVSSAILYSFSFFIDAKSRQMTS